MGSYRSFLIIAAAFAAPSLASAQEQEHVFVTGAMQDQEHIVVTGATSDGRPTVNRTASSRELQNLPIIYEDEPAPAPARTQGPAPAVRPTHG